MFVFLTPGHFNAPIRLPNMHPVQTKKTKGISSMTRMIWLILVFISMAALSLPLPVAGMDLELRSDTYLHLYQVDQPLGQDTDYAALFEYISLEVVKAGHPGVSLHMNGWTRFNLADETGGDTTDNDLSAAYACYRYDDNRGQVKLGRFLLAEGTSFEALDGVHFKQSFGKIGISLFGGSPNSDGFSESKRGDLLTGTRTFILSPGRFEMGLSYLAENGNFDGEEREEAGTDIWFRPMKTLEITGQALYNLTTSGLAFEDISLLVKPASNVEVTLGSSGYTYGDLFQAVTNPAFSGTLINPDDEVRMLTGKVQWRPVRSFGLFGAFKSTDHKESDPGNTDRSEIGLDISFPGLIERIGLRTAVQTGDQPENEFSELRSFAMLSAGPLNFSLDAMVMMYGEKISGEDQTIQVVGSAGWTATNTLSVSGDLRLTKSPVLEEDISVVFRANYLFEN